MAGLANLGIIMNRINMHHHNHNHNHHHSSREARKLWTPLAGLLLVVSATVIFALHQKPDVDLPEVTNTPDLRIQERCQQQHVGALASLFRELVHSKPAWSSCPEHAWLHKLQQKSPAGKKVLVDVGCNKGYTSAAFFALWAPELRFNPASLHSYMMNRSSGLPEQPCGACNDCQDEMEPAEGAQPQEDLQVVCVEPAVQSYAHLVSTREHFFNSSERSMRWHLVHAAVSNASGFVPFARCPAGDELCSLSRHEQPATAGSLLEVDFVPLMTLDQLFEMYNLTYVDVLKTDTEGFDMLAIAGATASLAGGRVGMLQFEYHGTGLWPQYQLADVVVQLQEYGYVCYFSGRDSIVGSLVRLTGCWDSTFEVHAWSNVLCIRRDHMLYPHAERMSTRYHKFRDVYYKETEEAAATAAAAAAAAQAAKSRSRAEGPQR